MTFKEKLVILRKTKHLTQDEFASAVGVSRQAVYKWESGQSYPEVPKLLEMKLLFGITIDELLDDNYDIPLPEKKRRKRMTKETKREIEKSVADSVAKAPKAPAAKAAAPARAAAAPKAAPVAPKTAPVRESVPAAAEVPHFTPISAAPEAPKFTPVTKPAAPEAPAFSAPAAPTAPETPVAPAYTTVSQSGDDDKDDRKGNAGFFGRLFGRK